MVKASRRLIVSCLPITSKKLKYNDLAMTNRTKAIRIMNREVEAIAMLGLSDLPDTAELAEYIDELEEMIDNEEVAAEVIAVAKEYAREFVSDECGDLYE
jgi:hypothetical protein